MSGECENCGEHIFECGCAKKWYETEEGKKQLLCIINEKFFFLPDGTALRRDEFCSNCKNEMVACVC